MVARMTLPTDAVIQQSNRTASRVVGGQAIVIVIDDQKLHTLNEVGTFVWTTLDGQGRRVAEVIDAVLEEFDVDREQATNDVTTFVEQLVALGAIEMGTAS